MPLLSSYIFRFFLLSPHSIFLPHHHPVVLLPPSSFPSFSPPPPLVSTPIPLFLPSSSFIPSSLTSFPSLTIHHHTPASTTITFQPSTSFRNSASSSSSFFFIMCLLLLLPSLPTPSPSPANTCCPPRVRPGPHTITINTDLPAGSSNFIPPGQTIHANPSRSLTSDRPSAGGVRALEAFSGRRSLGRGNSNAIILVCLFPLSLPFSLPLSSL